MAWALPEMPALRAIHPAYQALRGEGDGRVEAEGGGGLVQVVVDGLGHAHRAQPLLAQGMGDGEGAVPPDGDQGIQLLLGEVLQDLVRAVDLPGAAVRHPDGEVERVALVGGPEDGPAQVADAPHPVPGEAEHATFGEALREEDPVEALPDAVALPAPVRGGDDRGPDDRVEAGGVAAARADGDAPDGAGHGGSSERDQGAGTGTKGAVQMSRAYSRTVRSMENFPMPATFRMERRVHSADWA